MFKINHHIEENLVAWLKKPVALWKEGRTYYRCACEMMDIPRCNSYKKLMIMKMELVQQRGLKKQKEKGLGHKGSCFTLILSFICVLYYFTWLEMVSQGCMLTITHSSYTFTCTYISIHLYIVCVYFLNTIALKASMWPCNLDILLFTVYNFTSVWDQKVH
jgi:hypothetical protein